MLAQWPGAGLCDVIASDYHWVGNAQCYLVYAYAKNTASDLSKDQLQRLADVIAAEVKHG